MIKAIVVLVRYTTWRCGKLERLIVSNLYRSKNSLGKVGVPVKEMVQRFRLSGKKKNEFLDALKRLERRQIVRIQLSAPQ